MKSSVFEYCCCGIALFSSILINIVLGTPTWSVTPEDICPAQNTEAVFTCALDNLESPRLPRWSQETPTQRLVSNGEIVFTDACETCSISVNVERGEYNLIINPVQANDSGIWRCTNLFADPQFYEATLYKDEPCERTNITVEGADSSFGKTYNIPENRMINVTCAPDHCQPLCTKITWFKDSELLKDGSSDLIIETSWQDDGSVITCNATSGGKTVSDFVNLNISYAVRDVKTTVTDNSCPHMVKCTASGNPPPNFYWPIQQETVDVIFVERYDRYYCYTSNEHGNATSAEFEMEFCLKSWEKGLIIFCCLWIAIAIVQAIVVIIYCIYQNIALTGKDRLFIIAASFILLISIFILVKFISKKKKKMATETVSSK